MIALGTADPARLRTALVLLLATVALGGRARLFLEGAAAALAADQAEPLWAEALAAGVVVLVCQTGLAEAGLSADTLDQRLTYGGPVGLMAELGDDRLAIG
ncbi:MAG: peroxiredoxin [Sphingomonas fennica]